MIDNDLSCVDKKIKGSTIINDYHEFIAGYLAACTSISVLYPFNKIIFRQQLYGIDAIVAFRQLNKEGFSLLFRGLLPPLLQKSTSYSIMFGTQHQYYLVIKSYAQNTNFINKSYSEPILNGCAGIFAGLTEAALTPFERVQAILQTEKYHQKYKNTFHAFRGIYNDYGLRELYRGLNSICIRNGFANSMFFALRKPITEFFPHSTSQLQNTFYNFLTGALLGASLSTIIYPLNVLKANMQADIGGEFTTVYKKFRIIYESRDKRLSLYNKGISGNFWRALLSWGITNAAYELFLDFFKY